MKVVNRTGNTVYVEDIDTHFPYQNGQTEYINPDILKRSRCLRSFIISGLFDVIEYDESEKIENSIMYLRHKHGSPVEKPKTTKCQVEKINTEPVDLQSCTDDIEVKIHGIFLDAGGYAKVNRNLALKLAEAGIKVKVDPKRSTNQLTETDLAPIMKLQTTQISRNHILIDSIIPSFAEMSTGKYRILYTTIESYSVPKQFIDCCELYDEIWLTSEWSANILRKYVKKPIYAVVTGVDPLHYCETGPKFDLRPKAKDFIFISVFGWNYRKGYDVLLRAYLDEFSANDNVSLLLMSRYQSGQSRYHKNKVGDEIDEFMKEFPNKDLPHIVRFSKVTPEKDMPKVYRSCDCFVLPSRGEGGGLPSLEASMCGLPVIMTNCSGQQGYLREDNAYLLEIDRLTEIKPGQMHLHYWDKQQFPDLTSPTVHSNLKNLMRTVVNNKEESKLRNRNLQKMILENFTWNNTANQAIARLQEIQKKLKG